MGFQERPRGYGKLRYGMRKFKEMGYGTLFGSRFIELIINPFRWLNMPFNKRRAWRRKAEMASLKRRIEKSGSIPLLKSWADYFGIRTGSEAYSLEDEGGKPAYRAALGLLNTEGRKVKVGDKDMKIEDALKEQGFTPMNKYERERLFEIVRGRQDVAMRLQRLMALHSGFDEHYEEQVSALDRDARAVAAKLESNEKIILHALKQADMMRKFK